MSDILAEVSSPVFEVQMGNSVEGTAVVDNLTSTATDSALSANQGSVIKGLLDEKQDILLAGNNISIAGDGKTISANNIGGNFRASAMMTGGKTYRYVLTAAKAGDVRFYFGRTYTIKYDANGGTNAPAAQIKDYNFPITITTDTPTRAGYTFLGWAASSSATEPMYSPGGKYTGNSNATLYAVWTDEAIEATTLTSSRGYLVTFTAAGEKAYYDFTPTSNGNTYMLRGRDGYTGSVMLYDPDGNELDSGCDTGVVTSVNGLTGDVTIDIPTVTNDFTDEYKAKIDKMWAKLTSIYPDLTL